MFQLLPKFQSTHLKRITISQIKNSSSVPLKKTNTSPKPNLLEIILQNQQRGNKYETFDNKIPFQMNLSSKLIQKKKEPTIKIRVRLNYIDYQKGQ